MLRRRRGPFLSSLGAAGGQPPAPPIGLIVGTPPPHGLSETIYANQLDAMSGDPGLRLARSRGQRVFRGGGLALHRFDSAQGGPASEQVLDALPLQAGNQRRAVGMTRGALDGWTPDPEAGS